MSFGTLRELANKMLQLQACQRDKYVEQYGICVTAMVPLNSEGEVNSEVDYFGDKCAANRKDVVMPLIPQYSDYYSLIDIVGEDHENPLPLECLVRTCDYWPLDTIFRLPVMNTDGVLQDRYWRVINQNQKHLELVYSKKIQVVPARDHYVEGVN
jgi:hypothetical protein